MKETFQYWLVDNMDLKWYDTFISYRQGGFDSAFTRELSISLISNHSVGKSQRQIRSFLDNQSLAIGFDFQLKFASSLISSVLALPIVSYDSLIRMKNHDPVNEVDNLMIEWIVMIHCLENNIQSDFVRLRMICPIMIGKVENGNIGNLFDKSHNITKSLPSITPTNTISKVKELLNKLQVSFNSITLESLTVSSIVEKMLAFNGFSLSSLPDQNRVAMQVAEKIVEIINSIFLKDTSLDLGLVTGPLSSLPFSPPASPIKTYSTISPIKDTLVAVRNNAITQDQFSETLLVNPLESIENWLTSIGLEKYTTSFVEDLEVTTVGDLKPLKHYHTSEKLMETLKGSGVKMKKIDLAVLFSELTSLHI